MFELRYRSKNPNLDYYCFMQSQLQVWVTLQNNAFHTVTHYFRLTQAVFYYLYHLEHMVSLVTCR